MRWTALLPAAAIAGCFLCVGGPGASADTSTMPSGATTSSAVAPPADVNRTDWDYGAVQDLAAKGLIEGYPADADFLGGRTLTRYEMASIVARILERLDEIAKSGPCPQSIQPQVAEAKQLADDYKVELTVIGTNMIQADADIATLQSAPFGGKAGTGTTTTASASRSPDQAVPGISSSAYTSNPKSRYTIGGFVQTRIVDAASGSKARFPQGTAANQGAYNGDYAQGGAAAGAQVRRARLRFAGRPTDNATFASQLDFSGMISPSSQQVTVREAWAGYTFGDGNADKYPTITAGLFATPFGYLLPAATSAMITPERPLAFSEGGTIGLFNSQDYDKGIKAQYTLLPAGVTFTYAAINGSGRQNENIDGSLDSVFSANYTSKCKIWNAGVSYYDGFVYRTRPSIEDAATAPPTIAVDSSPTYPKPKKQLFDLNAQIDLKNGLTIDGEYVRGTYEARSYFDQSPSTGLDTFETDSYVAHNQVQGWYVMGGYTFGRKGVRPLTLAADYDVFQRSIDPHVGPNNAYDGNTVGAGTFYPGGASFDDVNLGYGVLYNLDGNTRLRLWYDQPEAVAHATGTPDPPKIGLATAEMQVKF